MCRVSASVSYWDHHKSNSSLMFSNKNTVATRAGSVSCYPTAVVPLKSDCEKVRFVLKKAPLNGNCISIGLVTRAFPPENSSGVGKTPNTWGVFEARDGQAKSANIYASEQILKSWRSLCEGDIITVEANIKMVRINVSHLLTYIISIFNL